MGDERVTPATSSGATIEFDHVSKRYAARHARCHGAGRGRGPHADGARGTHLRPRRPLRLRQDHDPQDGQPAHRAERRPHPHRRRRTSPAATSPSCAAASATSSSRSGSSRTRPSPRTWPRCRACWAGPRRASSARTDELLALVGLEPGRYRERYPSQLSGGERQRVGVARALAADPPVMLMDEPFGAVDPIVRERLQNEFLRLQEGLAKTILFVTHDIDEAIKMGDLVVVMEQGGRIAQAGAPADLLAQPASEYVARFVGADRGLKRLSLYRVADVRPRRGTPGARRGSQARTSGRGPSAAGDRHVLLVDDRDRPLGWLDAHDLRADGPARRARCRPHVPAARPAHHPQGRHLAAPRRGGAQRHRGRSRTDGSSAS